MIHRVSGTFPIENPDPDGEDITVTFAGSYEYVAESGPTASCGGQPPEFHVTIDWTNPPGYAKEAEDLVMDDPQKWMED